MAVSFFIMWIMLSKSYGFQWGLLWITLWDFTLLAIPACIFFCALACFATQRFASSVVVYAMFGGLWLGYLVLASMNGSPMLAGSSVSYQWLFSCMRLFDPFGNTALIALYQMPEPMLFGDLVFYINRLFYCAMAGMFFCMALSIKPLRAATAAVAKEVKITAVSKANYCSISTNPKAIKQLLQLTVLAIAVLSKQRVNQLLIVAWAFLMFNEVISGIHYAEALAVVSPTSLDALNRVSDDVLPLIGSFLALLWSWQLCWHNRHTDIAELIAATPVRSSILMTSHFFALSGLIVILVLLGGVSSFVAETITSSEVQLLQYIVQLSKAALTLILLGAIFTAFHTVCRSPMIAVAWCIGILVMKNTPLSGHLGLTHTLWNIASSPMQPADAFWGLEQSQSVYWPFMSFWIVLTMGFLCIAVKWSHRTSSLRNNQRWHFNTASTTLLIITLLTGFNLHNNIINERPLMSSDLKEQWRADYERAYSNWALIAQPKVSEIYAKVDIFPEQGKATFDLSYTLENRTNQAIDRILIGNFSATPIDKLDFSVPHTLEFDPILKQYIASLTTALKSGESIKMASRLVFKQPQYWPAVGYQIVKPSFTYLRGEHMLPTLGFQTQYTIRSAVLRQKYELSPLNIVLPSQLFAQPNSVSDQYDWVSIHSVVSTSAEQKPLAQGNTIKAWVENYRNYVEYQTVGAIRNLPVWFSVNRTALVDTKNKVKFTVYAPKINMAAKLNMLSMQDTVSWLSANIAPYQASDLSLLAMPNIGPAGYALPQIMMINHRVGFRAKPSPEAGFDQRYRRAVHETAHQWFGHDIGNSVLSDSAFLVESLAKYIELVMIERRYGEQAMQALVSYERQRFENAVMRSSTKTKALVDASEHYDMYSRATLVFAILREKLGDEVITQALRALWQHHAYPQTPATSMDFVRELKKRVSDEDSVLVDELLLSDKLAVLSQQY